MKKILVFGAGTAHGMWDTQGGWSERLRKELYSQTINSSGANYVELYNLGVRGDSVEQVRERLDSELSARDAHGDADLTVIFQVGANDAQFIYEEDDVKTSPEEFREHVDELAEHAGEEADHVYFMGLLPVDEEEVDPIPGDLEGRSFSTNRMKEYSGIVREAAEEKDCGFIPLMKNFEDEMLIDGLHPNSDGHEHIFKKVKRRLREDSVL